MAEILPQLEGCLPTSPRHLPLCPALPGVRPSTSSRSKYAGWPLGGRIDRVDVDAENRAVVIDYKHRSGVEELSSPTPRCVTRNRARPPSTTHGGCRPIPRRLSMRRPCAGRWIWTPARRSTFRPKGGKPRRGESAELLEEERGDGRIPGLKKGFPGEGGSMGFDALLDRVEAGIATPARARGEQRCRRRPDVGSGPHARCSYNHEGTFVRRDV